jgi:hypothetical protein
MLAWLLWRLEGMERARAAAHALMENFGDDAYSEARRREGEAKRDEAASAWRRVALLVARWTPRRVAIVAAPLTLPEPLPPTEIVSEQSQTFRIQFVCGTADQDLTEEKIEVADTPAAIIAAANIKWPPQTIGVRILDREGHEVFARQKARRA